MSGFLRQLSPSRLQELATAVERGPHGETYSLLLQRHGFGPASESIASELSGLTASGLTATAVSHLLRLLAAERLAAQAAADRTELVWSGPEVPGAASRDTAVVVRELFASATESVLVASFAVANGRHVFEALARRMADVPGLRVRLFLNVARPYLDVRPTSQILREFAEAFRADHWPFDRIPEVFYDPRALDPTPGPRACLHAKAIVVDDERAFVTSANFTEAAQDRNIEAGVLVTSRPFATTVRRQFDSLVEARLLQRLPL